MVGSPWKWSGRGIVFSLGKQIASARDYEDPGERGAATRGHREEPGFCPVDDGEPLKGGF